MISSSCIEPDEKQEAFGNKITVKDSIVIAKNNMAVTLDKAHSLIQATLKSTGTKARDSRKHYLVLLQEAELLESPEGVYEIYLSPENYSKEKLNPGNSYFINVIDTYSLKNNYKKQKLYFNVSDDLKETILKKNPSNFYVSILYRGNISPDNNESKNAGKLIIGNILLVEVN